MTAVARACLKLENTRKSCYRKLEFQGSGNSQVVVGAIAWRDRFVSCFTWLVPWFLFEILLLTWARICQMVFIKSILTIPIIKKKKRKESQGKVTNRNGWCPHCAFCLLRTLSFLKHTFKCPGGPSHRRAGSGCRHHVPTFHYTMLLSGYVMIHLNLWKAWICLFVLL